MAARRRMEAVKTAVLSLLLDAYQRRDKVALGHVPRHGAPPWRCRPPRSVEVAARRLADLPSGGRTPLAEGLLCAAETLRVEGIRDPRRRPLLVVVTDGRATAGADALRAVCAGRRSSASYRSPCGGDRLRDRQDQLRSRCSPGRHLGAECLAVGEVNAEVLTGAALRQAHGTRLWAASSGRGLMPEGRVEQVPADGLTTRQRRNRPLLIVHTGEGKGKSTAAFGLALRGWNQGWSIGVFQFVKSAKWRIGEQTALEALGSAARFDRPGRRGGVAQDGFRVVLEPKAGHRCRSCGGRPRGVAGDQAPAGRADPPALRARRVHLSAQLGLGRRRRGRRDPHQSRPVSST